MRSRFSSNFQDAPHGSAIFLEILRMLRTRARFSSKLAGCSAWEQDFDQKSKDAPDRSAILTPLGRRQIDEISRMSRAGGRFLKIKASKFAECSARDRNFDPIRTKINRRNLQDASTKSAIFEDTKTSKTSESYECSAGERNFDRFK